jgi:hypothetical protein
VGRDGGRGHYEALHARRLLDDTAAYAVLVHEDVGIRNTLGYGELLDEDDKLTENRETAPYTWSTRMRIIKRPCRKLAA